MTYSLKVQTQPAGQTCSVANGAGTVGTANVTNIIVTCSANSFTVGGTVSGLSGTVVLRNNGGNNLTVSANGPFTFSAALANASTYDVTVFTQPSGQSCSVTNGTGTIAGASVTNVVVICVANANTFTVGGTIAELSGSVVLQNNGGNNLTISANGAFTFPGALANGSTYSVTVLTQPSGRNCTIANGTGTIAGANITNVAVSCAVNTFTVGGIVSGLSGTVVLQNNSGNNLTVSVDGSFAFSIALPNATAYNVTVLTQPALQICTVSNGTGTIAGANISNVGVSCGTPAGASLLLFAGDMGGPGNVDGTGAAARFNLPLGVATDSAGNVYVGDNDTIRKITPAGVVTTLAGTKNISGSADGAGAAARFNGPLGVASDGAGNIYAADGNDTIRKITPAGVVTTLAGTAGLFGSTDGTGAAARFGALLAPPRGVATDNVGNVYVADTGNSTIRKITPAGVVTTLAGTARATGNTDGTGPAARFRNPSGVATDSAGNVYVADTDNHTIRKITPAGVVSTFAGAAGGEGSTDGTGTAARFSHPEGVASDSADNVYVADTINSTIRKITPAGVVTTLAGSALHVFPLPSTDGTGTAARFWWPAGVATDSGGNVYVADFGANNIRKVTPAGVVTTLTGIAASIGCADGTGAAARFIFPEGVAADSAGNVYVAASGCNTVRKIAPSGVVSTFAGTATAIGSADGTGAAARFNVPTGVASDSAGNVYLADSDNHTVRKITPVGVVTTLAGTAGAPGNTDGTGAAARFNNPTGLATDSAGNVYVGDSFNGSIRKITPAGVVSTLAAVGANGVGVATDSSGNVYVPSGYAILKISSAGVVTTLAGTAGIFGSADGTGAAARFGAQFGFPQGIATDSAGNVYVADTSNHTIRKITPAGVVTTVVGLAGQASYVPGQLPGLLGFPLGVAISGTSLYITLYNGVVVVLNVP
jgi:sugar lactone lactonase YvrE